MPAVWISLKKSLHCKSEASDVISPTIRNHHFSDILMKKVPRSGCSKSISNLKDVVVHGSRRHVAQPPNCSPMSIGSHDFLNPISHEVIISNNSKCELKITAYGEYSCINEDEDGSYVGTLRPGTPLPSMMQRRSPLFSGSLLSNGRFGVESSGFESSDSHLTAKPYDTIGCNGSCVNVNCQRCGEQFSKWEALEAHHLSRHAVTELAEGDSSRNIVEIICRTNYLMSGNNYERFERVLKVHNTQKTLAQFEEYRDAVKIKASKHPKRHPRCLADGNELLRFYGTTMSCSLGMNGSSSLCISQKCNVCKIIRHGFSTKKGEIGVFTTSTSREAFVDIYEVNNFTRKALIICRVIAGRVHKPLDNFQELGGLYSGFDSLAGSVELHSNFEELYLLNTRALLPCFVVIYKS